MGLAYRTGPTRGLLHPRAPLKDGVFRNCKAIIKIRRRVHLMDTCKKLAAVAFLMAMAGLPIWAQPASPPSVAPVAGTTPVTVEHIAEGLSNPWGVAFLSNGSFLITERPGRMRVVSGDGRLGPPLPGLPRIDAGGQGGLLDVITDAQFERNRRIFFCFSEPGDGKGGTNGTALASAVLPLGEKSLESVRVIFRQQPKVASRLHFGCRIAQAGDGSLFLTLGERFERKDDAQKTDNHLGKVVHVQPDGTPGPGNPFAGGKGGLPEI